MLGRLSILLVFVWALSATGHTQKAKNFSKKEIEFIESGNPNDTMRLWVITDERDSLFLRKEARDINLKKGEGTARYLGKRMIATMTHPRNAGVGIAAPQVGVARNMIVVQRFDKEETPVEVFVNPVIVSCSDSTQTYNEGCLSIPNQKGEVIRWQEITIDYLDLDGKKHLETVSGFTAVIFQHEIDHLKGILFIDHIKKHGLKN